jgi:rSAM/selenodomain-associated transferase 1
VTKRLALAVMAKRPQAGKVKARLCPPLTPEEAAQLAHCSLLDKLEQIRRFPSVARFVAFSPPDAEDFFGNQSGDGFSLLPQRGNDLGERLADLSDRLLGAGFAAAMIIGADSPTLPDAIIHEAHELLAVGMADVVLGPADDGGYYLIGLRRPGRYLFHGIAWGTATVLSQTLARAGTARLRTHLLPAWYDVDVEADLYRLARDLADDRTPALRTRSYLLTRAPFAGRDRIVDRT